MKDRRVKTLCSDETHASRWVTNTGGELICLRCFMLGSGLAPVAPQVDADTARRAAVKSGHRS